MEGVNLFCDIPNCGCLAEIFGVKGSLKQKYYNEHLRQLTSKKIMTLDIAGYHFISSLEDVPLYEARRNTVEKGLGSLAVVQAKCDSELFAALTVLERNEKKAVAMVVRSFREIRLKIQWKYEATKEELQALRGNFDQYLKSKQSELMESTQLLCENSAVSGNFLRVMIEDCSAEIAKTIAGCWMASKDNIGATIACLSKRKLPSYIEHLTATASDHLKLGHNSLAFQLSLYAQSIGWSGDIKDVAKANLRKQAEDLKATDEFFVFATEPADIDITFRKELAAQCIEIGLAAKHALLFSQSLYWLQSAWDILEKHSIYERELIEGGLALGEMQGICSGNYTEAQLTLRRCYDIEAEFDPLSEEAMKASIKLAGVCYHSGQWRSAEEVSVWVLQAFSSTNHAAEHFWTVLQYLIFAYWNQGKTDEAQRLIEEWRQKPRQGENKLSEMLKVTVLGRYAMNQQRNSEAEKLFISAIAIAEQYFPISVHAALAHRFLALLYSTLNRSREAEEHYRIAKEIYESVSPMSFHRALNFSSIGLVLKDCNRLTEAEEHYNSAKAIFDVVSPHSVDAANNLSNLALLLHCLKRFGESELHYWKAKDIFDAVAPLSVQAALNLYNMALLLKEMKRFSEAEKHYRQAKEIYATVAPLSIDGANNFYSMGVLAEAMGKTEEAISAFETARTIFVSNQSVSDVKDAEIALSRLRKVMKSGRK